MKAKTQTEAIKIALANDSKLSSLNSFREVGCMRLSARIFDLEELGWVIKKEWKQIKTRFGTHCRYVEYSLDKSKTPKKLYAEHESFFFKIGDNRFQMR